MVALADRRCSKDLLFYVKISIGWVVNTVAHKVGGAGVDGWVVSSWGASTKLTVLIEVDEGGIPGATEPN